VQVDVGVFPMGSANKPKGLKHVTSSELSNSVKDMRVENNVARTGMVQAAGAKERVSFGTNMSTEEQTSDGRLVQEQALILDTVVARFHARKFGTNVTPYFCKKNSIL
jgi:hypothetical protein